MALQPRLCYNCGIAMNRPGTQPLATSQTREHIPAQNLFIGYPDEYKANRITVPGCYNCNQEYSTIDNEMRDALGVINERDPLRDEITRRAVRNMIGRDNFRERVVMTEDQRLGFIFNYEPFFRYNIKNFKGIFHHICRFPFPNAEYGVWSLFVNGGDEQDRGHMERFGFQLYELIIQNAQWEHSGHPNIFQYIIKGVHIDRNNNCTFNDNVSGSPFIMCICKYHNQIEMITLAFNRGNFNVPEGF